MKKYRSGNRKTRQRAVRFLLAAILVFCCMLSFSCGKMVGKAQKQIEQRQEARGSKAGTGETDGKKNVLRIRDKKEQGPETGDGETDLLILVNREHPLPADHEVKLVTFQNGVTQGAEAAYDPLCQMLRAGIREGLSFRICSAYRSVERQQELYDEDVRALTARGYSYEQACREVEKETQPPGCSEHATGLAFDIVAVDNQKLDASQENTAENKWLQAHCAEYGFILRYPKEKEDVTGIRYESWHFRYVGAEAAQEITERGITLEEYLEEF